MKRKMIHGGMLLGLTMMLCTGCGLKHAGEETTAEESVSVTGESIAVSSEDVKETETDGLSQGGSKSEIETEENVISSETEEPDQHTAASGTAELVPTETAPQETAEHTADGKSDETLPLTASEIEEALQAMGYRSVIVNELEDHTFAVPVYENTLLCYIVLVDPVTGVGEVTNSYDEPLGTIDVRTRTVISGDPLPAPEAEFVPAPAVLSEPLTEEFVLERLKEYYVFSENPGVGEYYDYPAAEEDTFVYYDWMTGVSGVGHTITVYRYSGQAVVRDEHGRYEKDFMLPLP